MEQDPDPDPYQNETDPKHCMDNILEFMNKKKNLVERRYELMQVRGGQRGLKKSIVYLKYKKRREHSYPKPLITTYVFAFNLILHI